MHSKQKIGNWFETVGGKNGTRELQVFLSDSKIDPTKLGFWFKIKLSSYTSCVVTFFLLYFSHFSFKIAVYMN